MDKEPPFEDFHDEDNHVDFRKNLKCCRDLDSYAQRLLDLENRMEAIENKQTN